MRFGQAVTASRGVRLVRLISPRTEKPKQSDALVLQHYRNNRLSRLALLGGGKNLTQAGSAITVAVEWWLGLLLSGSLSFADSPRRPMLFGCPMSSNTRRPASILEYSRDQSGLSDGCDTVCRNLRGPDGPRRLYDEYAEQLIRLATRNIAPGLRRRFDGEDVVQSVFRTFFRRLESKKLRIRRSEELWKLLVSITLCKTRSHSRRHTAECRDVKLEMPLGEKDRVTAPKASVEDLLALWEEIQLVVDGLPDRTMEIISRRIEGQDKTEIAAALNITRQTVHRLLRIVEARLEERLHNLSSTAPSG